MFLTFVSADVPLRTYSLSDSNGTDVVYNLISSATQRTIKQY